jgi:hypothetical protein
MKHHRNDSNDAGGLFLDALSGLGELVGLLFEGLGCLF